MSAKAKVITVVGSVNADVIVEITRFPKPGETMSARKDNTGYVLPGGKGANQAVAAKRLGGDAVHVNFIGVFGNDGNAGMLRKVLEGERVDISQSLSADVPNGQALIFLDKDGENSIILIGGSNLAWPAGPVPQAIVDVVKGSDVVLLQREIPDRINVEVAAVAAAAGCVVVSDVGGADTVRTAVVCV
jgi:ribokinase